MYKSILTLITGTFFAQLISIAATFLLTRLYSPQDFGLLAVYIFWMSALTVIATGRYELAILLPKKIEYSRGLYELSILISKIVSLILMLIIISISILFPEMINGWVYLLPFGIYMLSVFQSKQKLYNRYGKYKRVSVDRVKRSFGTSISQVIFGFFGLGYLGLILGNILGLGVANRGKIREKITTNQMKFLAHEYISFPKINIWSGLLSIISMNMPIILFSMIATSQVVGYFSLVSRVLQMPLQLVGGAIGEVFFKKISKNSKEENKNIYSVVMILLAIGFIPSLTLVLYGEKLFLFILGEEWKEAGRYSELLSIWFYLVFVSAPLSYVLIIKEKHQAILFFDSIFLLARLFSIMIPYYLNESFLQIIMIYGVANSFVWVVFLIYQLNIVNVSYFKSVCTISPPVVVLTWITLGGFKL